LAATRVLECLRAAVPATALFVALGAEADERLTESVRLAADSGISILEVPRHDLDRIAANGLHQGIALQVPPYQYAHPDDVLAAAKKDGVPALMVALDNISDPRNLGAIVRSVAAFGGNGVLIPQRRSASVTAVAWRHQCWCGRQGTGGPGDESHSDTAELGRRRPCRWSASMAGGDTTVDELDGTGPMVVVVGSEGKGLSTAGARELRRRVCPSDGRADRVVERHRWPRAWCWPKSRASEGVNPACEAASAWNLSTGVISPNGPLTAKYVAAMVVFPPGAPGSTSNATKPHGLLRSRNTDHGADSST